MPLKPRLSRHHEWLAGVVAEMDRKAGLGPSYDEAFLANTIDERIQRARDMIRVAEELRAVMVRPMSPAMPPAPPPAAQAEAAPRRPSSLTRSRRRLRFGHSEPDAP
jgi:hypothetical protein